MPATLLQPYLFILQTLLLSNGLISINGHKIFRKDRSVHRGGGICVFISDDISAKRRPDIEDPNFECLWFSLRPTRLPRPLSCIMVCVVYHPPGLSAKDHQDLNDYLVSTIDTLRTQYPDCGIVLLGDFNDFNISNLLPCHSMKQVVDQPTRGTSILDLIITKLFHLCQKPHVLAPLGTSDHNSVRWLPG